MSNKSPYIGCPVINSDFLSYISPFSLSILASLLFLKYVKYTPISGPLHLLFPQIPACFFPHFIQISPFQWGLPWPPYLILKPILHSFLWLSTSDTPDGVQVTLPQNRAPWHLEYFKLKVWGNIRSRRSFWPSSGTSPLNRSWKLHVRGALFTPGRKSILISKDKGTQKNWNTQALLSLSQFATLASFSLIYHIPP